MSDLKNLASNFELIVEIGYDLSQKFDGVDTDNRRKKVSTYYLAKIIPECMSLLKILPWSRLSKDDIFDFSSFCSLARNIIEGSNLHWYYCVDEIGEAEVDFRFMLYDYHDNTTIYRLGEFLGDSPEELSGIEAKRKNIRIQLEANPIFCALDEAARKQIIKGRKCSHLIQAEIAKRRGLDVDFFNGVYKLLSSNVHSTPSAIRSIVHARVFGRDLEEAYTGLLLTYVPSFVAHMINEIGKMWGLQFALNGSEEIIRNYSDLLYERS